MKLPSGNIPRWIIFFIDLCLIGLAFTVAYLLRFELQIPENEKLLGIKFLPFFFLVRIAFSVVFKSYAGIIRFTSTQDTGRIFKALLCGTIVLLTLNLGNKFVLGNEKYLLSNSVIAIEFLLSLVGLIVFRLSVKLLYAEFKNPSQVRSRIAIFGAGESGLITKQTIDQDPSSRLEVVAYFDDDKKKVNKKLDGVHIHHINNLKAILEAKKVDQIIISIQNLNPLIKREIAEKALAVDVEILNVPPVKKWIKGELSLKQLQAINIEDLLGREPIKLSNEKIKSELEGKTILVTGGAGSIGSELVRQIMFYNPKKLWIFDQAESPLYELQQELKKLKNFENCEIAIGDVTQKERVFRLMEACKPDIIFHAAAYKHVPLMEENPSEAILTNVSGTKHLADAASEFRVGKFVFVSTDKAVNPTNVMGASKRAAEMYCQAKNEASKTQFIATRFGNVLGSNGSVIPLFKKQIEQGGPLTVTHKEVTRYFMTIPEAVQLVLEASIMGKGGEVFVFDMGESIKIYDLAKKMLKLSGLKEGRDIEIQFTGLRPGEKLYEELLASDENSLETHHPKILIAKLKTQNHDQKMTTINELITLFLDQDNLKLVSKLKEIVPEFKSENSVYNRLDN